MPTVAEAARITTPHDATWRTCAGCGRLAAMPDDLLHCRDCADIPARQLEALNAARARRRAVVTLAAPGIGAAREVYQKVPADAVRVAALVEMAAAAASLARTVMRLRRLDARSILPLVSDGTDLRAVLGRGRWLPAMTRHVPDPGSRPVDLSALIRTVSAAPVAPASVRRRATRRAVAPGQSSLFDATDGK